MRGKVAVVSLNFNSKRITPAYAGKRLPERFNFLVSPDHPRLCGEKYMGVIHYIVKNGSPPPMRGKVVDVTALTQEAGITPAYAGKSPDSDISFFEIWDHPRLCGEKGIPYDRDEIMHGSPPPMRGKVAGDLPCRLPSRITPAYAGKSSFSSGEELEHWDHPRLCGEKILSQEASSEDIGSPPPMRGKGLHCGQCPKYRRITPAYAGKSGFRAFP